MKISRFFIIFLIGLATFYGVGLISGEDGKGLVHILTSLLLALFLATVLEYFYAKKG